MLHKKPSRRANVLKKSKENLWKREKVDKATQFKEKFCLKEKLMTLAMINKYTPGNYIIYFLLYRVIVKKYSTLLPVNFFL